MRYGERLNVLLKSSLDKIPQPEESHYLMDGSLFRNDLSVGCLVSLVRVGFSVRLDFSAFTNCNADENR